MYNMLRDKTGNETIVSKLFYQNFRPEPDMHFYDLNLKKYVLCSSLRNELATDSPLISRKRNYTLCYKLNIQAIYSYLIRSQDQTNFHHIIFKMEFGDKQAINFACTLIVMS